MTEEKVTYYYASDSKESFRFQATKVDESGIEMKIGKPGELQTKTIDPPYGRGISNNSQEPYGFKLKDGRPANFTFVPGNTSHAAEIVISPNAYYTEVGTDIVVPRASIILHELIESVERTGNGKSYEAAHSSAKLQVTGLDPADPRYTPHPGEATAHKIIRQ